MSGILGGNEQKSRQLDVYTFFGNFIGQGAVNGALAVQQRADGTGNLTRYMTLTRTAAGKYTAQITNGSANGTAFGVPVILQASMQIRSTNAAPVQIVCQPAAYNAAAGTVTFILYTPSTLALTDPTATEFVEVEINCSNQVHP